MTTFDRIQKMRDQILDLAKEHGVTSIRVFGSVVRGEDSPDSDIDFLVVIGPVTSSWFPAGLVLDLEDLLGRSVEVVTERSLDPRFRERILHEAVAL